MASAARMDGCGDAECELVAKEVGVKEKTGTLISTVSHILTAMIGAGVLGMPLSLGNLGWVAGPAAILFFYAVSLVAAYLLASLFRVDGVTHPRYFEAVRHILGRRAELVAACLQLINIFLVCIAYIITASTSMTTLANLACSLPPGQDSTGDDGCFNSQTIMTVIFGGVQVFFAQLPNIEESSWVSMMGAATSISYTCIALGLSIGKVADGNHHGSIGGIAYSNPGNKLWAVLNSLGSIGFAYSFSQILLEVQDTVREPPESKATMHKAAGAALTIGACFYLVVGSFGYLALGADVPSIILTAFDSPKWLVMLAQVLVVLHMVAAYNVFSQTFFLTLEGWVARLLGMRHPAEHAALQAATVALAADVEPQGLEKGEGKDGPHTASEATTLPRASMQLPAAALSARVLRARSRGGQRGGPLLPADSAELMSQPRGSAPVALAQLSTDPGVVQRSARSEGHPAGLPSQAGKQGSPYDPAVIHAFAAVDEGRVVGIAGPYRMRSSFRTVPGPSCEPPAKPKARHMLLSFVVRAVFVVITTVMGIVMPFFSEITGIIGSATFWPIAIYFPFTMFIHVYQPTRGKRLALHSISAFMLVVSVAATVASVRNIIDEWSTFTFV